MLIGGANPVRIRIKVNTSELVNSVLNSLLKSVRYIPRPDGSPVRISAGRKPLILRMLSERVRFGLFSEPIVIPGPQADQQAVVHNGLTASG